MIEGADHTARFLVGVTRRGWREGLTDRLEMVNGLPGVVVYGPGGVVQATAFEIDDGLIRTIYAVRNPDKLKHIV